MLFTLFKEEISQFGSTFIASNHQCVKFPTDGISMQLILRRTRSHSGIKSIDKKFVVLNSFTSISSSVCFYRNSIEILIYSGFFLLFILKRIDVTFLSLGLIPERLCVLLKLSRIEIPSVENLIHCRLDAIKVETNCEIPS